MITAIDTAFRANNPCTIYKLDDEFAVVVYDDEPDCFVSTGNYPGRFQITRIT